MKTKKIKLSEWAKINQMHYRSAWRLYKEGKLEDIVEVLPSGKILVKIEQEINEELKNSVFLYARVSSNDQKEDLDKQLLRLVSYATEKGYKIVGFEKEIASGLNDSRPKLHKALTNKKYSKLIVEHRDRLSRFRFNLIQLLLKETNKEIEVINESLDKDSDLIDDFVSIITSFCSRIYGSRRSKRKIITITEDLLKLKGSKE